MMSNPMSVSNFSKAITTKPSNLVQQNGEVQVNDNLKPENVQVHINSVSPDYQDTPSGQKTAVYYLA